MDRVAFTIKDQFPQARRSPLREISAWKVSGLAGAPVNSLIKIEDQFLILW